jgi:hypothetical protein
LASLIGIERVLATSRLLKVRDPAVRARRLPAYRDLRSRRDLDAEDKRRALAILTAILRAFPSDTGPFTGPGLWVVPTLERAEHTLLGLGDSELRALDRDIAHAERLLSRLGAQLGIPLADEVRDIGRLVTKEALARKRQRPPGQVPKLETQISLEIDAALPRIPRAERCRWIEKLLLDLWLLGVPVRAPVAAKIRQRIVQRERRRKV